MGYETVADLVEVLEKSLKNAETGVSVLPTEIANMRGMSAPKIRRFLNNVCSFGPCKYLEIGTYSGSTLIPALYKNKCKGLAIDNWSQFGPEQCDGYNARKDLNENLMKWGPDIFQYEIVNEDCFGGEAFWAAKLLKPNVFFYDGPHDKQSTYQALVKYGDICENPFILIVDDLELDEQVRIGLEWALEYFTMHQCWELPKNGDYHMGVWTGVVSK